MRSDIKQLKKELDRLRQANGGRLVNVPEKLQRLTAKSLQSNSWSEVKAYLQISNSTLSRWRRLYLVDETFKNEKDNKLKRAGKSGSSCLAKKSHLGHTPHNVFAEIDPGIVSAAIQITSPQKQSSDKDFPKVDVEVQTQFGSAMRVSGALDASIVCQLAQIICNSEGGRR